MTALATSTPPVVVSPSVNRITVNPQTQDIAIAVSVPSITISPTVQSISVRTLSQGPPGPAQDPVCVVKPSSTLTYDGGGNLIRVDFTTGQYKTLAYDGSGNLETVACVTPGVSTITKTLGYDGSGNLISVDVAVT